MFQNHRQDFDMIPNAWSAAYVEGTTRCVLERPIYERQETQSRTPLKGTVFASEVKLLERLPNYEYDNFRKP